MIKPTLADIERLVKEVVLPFYQVRRHTPLRFEKERYENDAEHSWSLALVACALAPHVDPGLDIGKVSQFATVHDLVEVYAGDTSNFAADSEKATKDQREHEALQKLKRKFAVFPWMVATIQMYESQEAEEARFVKSVDKILPLLFDYIEEGQFYKENNITVEVWQQQLANHRRKAQSHSGAFSYYDELWNLLLANPHFFHQKGTGQSSAS